MRVREGQKKIIFHSKTGKKKHNDHICLFYIDHVSSPVWEYIANMNLDALSYH